MIKNPENAKKSIKLMLSQTKDFIGFLISNICVVLSEVAILVLIKKFIDEIISKGSENVNLLVYTISFISIMLGLCLFAFIREIARSNIVTKVRYELLSNAYNGLICAEVQEINEKTGINSVSNLIKNGDKVACDFIGLNVLEFVKNLVSIIVFFVSAMIINPICGIVLLGLIVFYILFIKASDRIRDIYKNKINIINKNCISYMEDTHNKIENIKLLNAIEDERRSFNYYSDMYKKYKNRYDICSHLSSNVINILFSFTFVLLNLILYIIFKDMEYISFTIGLFVLFTLISPIIFVLLHKIINRNISPSQVENEINELDDLANLHTEVRSEPVKDLGEINKYSAKNLSYRDKGGKTLLDNISFEVKKQESLGIFVKDKESRDVLFSLLMKFIRPIGGEIKINEDEYSKIQVKSIREVISPINKHFHVFNSTIRESIIFPNSYNDYHYNEAINKSGIREIINELDKKDFTSVDDEKLKSRSDYKDFLYCLSFANAFYKDSIIYIINDDNEYYSLNCEEKLFDEISKLKNKIIINITDKPYLLYHYDKILVIEKGKKVEYGLYDDLINKKTSKLNKALKSMGIGNMPISGNKKPTSKH